MEWQWHQLDHMQTDNYTSNSSLTFLQAGCSTLMPNQQHQSTEDNNKQQK